MKKTVIGFDFDKVFIGSPPLVPYALIDFLYKGRQVLSRRGSKKPMLHYRFPGLIEQSIRRLSHVDILRPAILENVSVLKKISAKQEKKIYLVSSRFNFLKKRTDTVLKKYDLIKYFDGIYFNTKDQQPHLFKEEMIKKLKIEIYIDDDIDLSLFLANKNPKLRIYWITPGGYIPTALPKNIIPIKNLTELPNNLK